MKKPKSSKKKKSRSKKNKPAVQVNPVAKFVGKFYQNFVMPEKSKYRRKKKHKGVDPEG